MHIHTSGHHIEITDGIRSAIKTNLGKISKHYPDIQEANVILKVDKNEQSIEISMQYLGSSISVRAADQDLYIAIKSGIRKLDSTLEKKKGLQLHSRKEKVETATV